MPTAFLSFRSIYEKRTMQVGVLTTASLPRLQKTDILAQLHALKLAAGNSRHPTEKEALEKDSGLKEKK